MLHGTFFPRIVYYHENCVRTNVTLVKIRV